MIKGIGSDMVDIYETERLISAFGESFLLRLFTEAERQAAEIHPEPAVFLSERFAAKEAAFKAVAHNLPSHTFDFTIVETLNMEDGHPEITLSGQMEKILSDANISQLHVSLSSEGNFALATVIAEE